MLPKGVLLAALPTAMAVACSGSNPGTAPEAGRSAEEPASPGPPEAPADPSPPAEPGLVPISYARDVRPLFVGRCTFCHHPANAVNVNIEDPFDSDNGLVGSVNTWSVAHPEAGSPALNVAPFEPDSSFLLDKIENPNIDPASLGAFMPWAPPRLTDQELGDLRQWISDGANDDQLFQTSIRRIFGNEAALGGAGGKCTYCHNRGGVPPNLTDPFDTMTGAVNVRSLLAPDLLRIAPGDPEASLLVLKVEARDTTGGIGAPMPLQYPPMTAEQVETVRRWIAEGALNN